MLQAIRELAAGGSPDGGTLATRIMIFYGFTLGLNVFSTRMYHVRVFFCASPSDAAATLVLIALRIYLSLRQARKAEVAQSSTLQMTMTIVIESGVSNYHFQGIHPHSQSEQSPSRSILGMPHCHAGPHRHRVQRPILHAQRRTCSFPPIFPLIPPCPHQCNGKHHQLTSRFLAFPLLRIHAAHRCPVSS